MMNEIAMHGGDWVQGRAYLHKGWMIYCAEERGRRFFSTLDPTPIGWAVSQEFSAVDDARRMIDEREIEKMLWRLSV